MRCDNTLYDLAEKICGQSKERSTGVIADCTKKRGWTQIQEASSTCGSEVKDTYISTVLIVALQ